MSRVAALGNAIGIGRRAPKIICLVNSIGQRPPSTEETVRIGGGETIASRQRCDLNAMGIHEAIRHHDKATIRFACLCCNDGFELEHVVNGCYDRLHCDGGGGSSEEVQPIFRTLYLVGSVRAR